MIHNGFLRGIRWSRLSAHDSILVFFRFLFLHRFCDLWFLFFFVIAHFSWFLFWFGVLSIGSWLFVVQFVLNLRVFFLHYGNRFKLNPLLNSLFLLALHKNDNPAILIVLESLTGLNFISWSHAVKRALSVKNKLPLIDGSLNPPLESVDRVIHAAWIRANGLVLTWILNLIHADIKQMLDYFTWTKEVWDELHAMYSQSGLTRVYHLEKSQP